MASRSWLGGGQRLGESMSVRQGETASSISHWHVGERVLRTVRFDSWPDKALLQRDRASIQI